MASSSSWFSGEKVNEEEDDAEDEPFFPGSDNDFGILQGENDKWTWAQVGHNMTMNTLSQQ